MKPIALRIASFARLAGCAALVALAACGSRAPLLPPSAQPGTTTDATSAGVGTSDGEDRALQRFELTQANRAVRAEAEGRWADAALAWEIQALLRPDDPHLRDRLASARQHVSSAAAERLAAAQAAQRRSDLDAAVQTYLEVLALDPTQRAAADALRQIERDRSRRSIVGRFARPLLARKPGTSELEWVAAHGAESGRTANSLHEHATLLARQGDPNGAIQLLRDSPLLRSDAGLRGLLLDLHLQRAEALKTSHPDQARAAVDAALALDRRHAGALALQRQLGRDRPKAPPGASASGTATAAAASPGTRAAPTPQAVATTATPTMSRAAAPRGTAGPAGATAAPTPPAMKSAAASAAATGSARR